MIRIITFCLIILVSCGESNTNEPATQDQQANEESMENMEMDTLVALDRLQNLFPFFNDEQIKIEVKPEDYKSMFSDDECIPLNYLSSFNDIIHQTSSTTTGAKPIGKIQLDPYLFLLVFVQQDDYGPIYYGATYDVETDKIQSTEIIGLIWEDAGYSQTINSNLTVYSDSLIITKKISTCLAELEVKGQEMVAASEECSDSTAVVRISKMDL